MPVRRGLLLAVLAAALAALLPAAARAAVAPYTIAKDGAGVLVAAPAGDGSTLAVDVVQTAAGVEFTPAAATYPGLPDCTSTLLKTTCHVDLKANELRLAAAVLDVGVTAVATNLLTLTGGPESDSIVVDGPGPTTKVSLAPGAGADSVTVRGAVGEIALSGSDTGDDRFLIQSTPTLASTLALGAGNDVATSTAPNLTIDGGAGNDTLIGASALLGGADSDVIEPTVTNATAAGGDGGTPEGVDRLSFRLVDAPLTLTKLNATDVQVTTPAAVPVKTGFERLEGTRHNDTLVGTAADDRLFGGAGDDVFQGNSGGDVLDGGPGHDTVDYGGAGGAAVTVNLATGSGAVAGLIADTLVSIAGVRTAAGNDDVTGTAAAETFQLGAGNDVVSAGAGDDTIDAGPGDDPLLRGGPGADTIDGGPGIDTITYDERGPNEPLHVTLATPGGDGAAGEGDALFNTENLVGGASNDTLVGNDGPNVITGGPGLDTIDGLGGGDALYGGEARDTIAGGPGPDLLFGEGDDDSINAFDGEPDVVDCGPSPDDDAQVDAPDTVAGCEFARRGDVPVPVEGDGDGFVAGFDCDDANPAINPGATDIVGDGIDQNCDGFDEPVPFVDYGLSLRFSKATASGRRITRLTVSELPAGHSVRISCTTPKRYARRCPFTRATRRPARSGTVSLTSLFRKRVLPPGTRIELRITAPGFNGRVRRFTIRAVGAVRDQRLCLTRGRTTPRPCPAGED